MHRKSKYYRCYSCSRDVVIKIDEELLNIRNCLNNIGVAGISLPAKIININCIKNINYLVMCILSKNGRNTIKIQATQFLKIAIFIACSLYDKNAIVNEVIIRLFRISYLVKSSLTKVKAYDRRENCLIIFIPNFKYFRSNMLRDKFVFNILEDTI